MGDLTEFGVQVTIVGTIVIVVLGVVMLAGIGAYALSRGICG